MYTCNDEIYFVFYSTPMYKYMYIGVHYCLGDGKISHNQTFCFFILTVHVHVRHACRLTEH